MGAPRRAESSRVGHRTYPSLSVLPVGPDAPPPPPPPGIRKGTRARKLWDAVWESELARVIDRRTDLPRLERWIWATAELERVRRTLQRTRLVRGSTGQPVLNPLASYAADLERTIEKAEDAFGMTPKARLGLGLDVAQLAKTAADLNRMLESDDDGDEEPTDEAIPGEWVEG